MINFVNFINLTKINYRLKKGLFALILCSLSASCFSDEGYVLSADDIISVTVFNEPDLSLKQIRVSSSGTISMPLIGQVFISGMNVSDVEEKIRQMYLGDYLKKPDVSVSVVEYRPFYVNGEVDNPGAFGFREGMTVQRAITLAGGFTERAARNKISIIRENSDGTPIPAELGTFVQPGDVVTIKESFF